MARLTSRNIFNMPEGTHSDDGCTGLYLRVTGPKARSWILRTRVHGREQAIGLGSAELVTREEAREEAVRLRKIARAGGDPLAELRAKRDAENMTVERAVRAVFEGKTFRNPKSAGGWIKPFERHVFPKIGKRPVQTIASRDIVSTLAPHWIERHDTAAKLRQRLGEAFDWAKVHGHYDGENPIAGTLAGLPQVKAKTTPRAAASWTEVPEIFAAMGQIDRVVAKLTQFIILTGVRQTEARLAEWSEFDLTGDGGPVWNVPAERMKMDRDFRVPLSTEAAELVESMRGIGRRLVFPSTHRHKTGEKPLSDSAVRLVLRDDLGRRDLTIHGFRSSLRSWMQENLPNLQFEAAEMVLSHRVGGTVSQAYARSDYLDARRPVMEAWARHCAGRDFEVVELKPRLA